MIEGILFFIGFGLFVCTLLRFMKVREPLQKRKYVTDRFDLLDEPQAKKSRFQNLNVMRVLPLNHNELLANEQNNGGEFFLSDDDSILDYMSDSTIDEIEYFNRDLHRYLNDCDHISISSSGSSSDVILVEENIDTVSVSSESIISVSSSSSVEFMDGK